MGSGQWAMEVGAEGFVNVRESITRKNSRVVVEKWVGIRIVRWTEKERLMINCK